MPGNYGDAAQCGRCIMFDSEATENGDDGFCRIEPPRVVIMEEVSEPIDGRRRAEPVFFTTWPIVQKQDWCGRFVSVSS